MRHGLPLVSSLLVLGLSASAMAQPYADRISFGHDVVVARDEVVGDVVTMGGDARIEGEVRGDVITMGGDALVDGKVLNDVVTMGGDITVRDTGSINGDAASMGGTINAAASSHVGHRLSASGNGWHPPKHAGFFAPAAGVVAAVFGVIGTILSYGLLWVLGLLLFGLGRERFEETQVDLIRAPVGGLAIGLAGVVAATLAIVVLAVTIVGIPVAIVLALALPIALYAGLSVAAAVLGAALPIEALRGKPITQLTAGVITVAIVSLVPFIGPFLIGAAALAGFGALLRTHKRRRHHPQAAGPYRSAPAAP